MKIGTITHIGLGIKAGQRNKVQDVISASLYSGSRFEEAARGYIFRPPAKNLYLLPLEVVDVGLGGQDEDLGWKLDKNGTITVPVDDPEEVGCALYTLGFANKDLWVYQFGKNCIRLEQGPAPKSFHVGIDFESLESILRFQEVATLRTPANHRFHNAVATKKKSVKRGTKSGSFYVRIGDIGVEFTFGPHGLSDHFSEKTRPNTGGTPVSPYTPGLNTNRRA